MRRSERAVDVPEQRQSEPETLLMRSRQAAAMLQISEKLLWSMTRPRGPINCVRFGRAVRYSPDVLRAFIAQQSQT
jgi:hypothetical protein